MAERTDCRFVVEAYHNSELRRATSSYRLIVSPAVHANDTAHLVAAMTAARAALAKRGLFEAADGVVPDIEITIEFTFLERTELKSPFFRRFRLAAPPSETPEVIAIDENGRAIQPPQSRVPPIDLDHIPWQGESHTGTFFEKRLVLAAREVRSESAGTPARELWRVLVRNKDERSDADEYTRLMLATAVQFIARNTNGRKEVTVAAVDDRTTSPESRG